MRDANDQIWLCLALCDAHESMQLLPEAVRPQEADLSTFARTLSHLSKYPCLPILVLPDLCV